MKVLQLKLRDDDLLMRWQQYTVERPADALTTKGHTNALVAYPHSSFTSLYLFKGSVQTANRVMLKVARTLYSLVWTALCSLDLVAVTIM